MNIQEAKEILVPLCPQQADGRPLSPGFCDADLIAIASHIQEADKLLLEGVLLFRRLLARGVEQ